MMKRGNIERKSIVAVFTIFFTLFFFIAFVSGFSNSNIGNSSNDVVQVYAPSENLMGWINISLTNETFNSKVTALYSSNDNVEETIIKSILTGVSYNCSSRNCSMEYTSSESGNATFLVNLNSRQSSIPGMKILDNPLEIDSFLMDIVSNGGDSCRPALEIDLGGDGVIDWYSESRGTDFCTSENYGCFSIGNKITMPIDRDYCETINISHASILKVGAGLSGSGNGSFLFSADDEVCSVNVTSPGTNSENINCMLNLSIYSPRQIQVCVRQTSGDYEIYYENTPPVCGESNGESFDFNIYARPIKFGVVGYVNLSKEEYDFSTKIQDYINSQYAGDCSRSCYIPFKLISYSDNQQINIQKAKLDYEISPGGRSTDLIYSLSETPSKINMGFKLLSLNNSGLKVPSTPGYYNLTLKIDDRIIFKKQIQVLALPVVDRVYPTNVPAGADVTYHAVVSGGNITRYIWSFGDNTTLETTVNSAEHKYSIIGTKTLTVSAINANGQTNKTFSINITSPSNYLNNTLTNYKNITVRLRSSIAGFPLPVKTAIERKLNLTTIEASLASLQVQFNSAGNDSARQVEILNSLLTISLPSSINVTESYSGKYLVNPSVIDAASLATALGTPLTANANDTENSIAAWIMESLNINSQIKVYSFFYEDYVSREITYASLSLEPLKSLGNVYTLINLPSSNIIFGESVSVSSSTGVTSFSSDLSSSKTFDFTLTNAYSFLELPIYFSPALSELNIISDIGVCNFNKKCEANKGENARNCRSDCKPWKTALWLILLIIFVIFCVYIACQEWYKRRYESHLFKDKNDLFNLIAFIDNAEKQKLDRETIFQKLKEKKWATEQIEFAYKKYHGKRTGMFEIPIFKFLENRKVKTELEARSQTGKNTNSPPIPLRPFVPRQPVLNQGIQRPMNMPLQQQKPVQPSAQPMLKPQNNPNNKPNNILPMVKPQNTNQNKNIGNNTANNTGNNVQQKK